MEKKPYSRPEMFKSEVHISFEWKLPRFDRPLFSKQADWDALIELSEMLGRLLEKKGGTYAIESRAEGDQEKGSERE